MPAYLAWKPFYCIDVACGKGKQQSVIWTSEICDSLTVPCFCMHLAASWKFMTTNDAGDGDGNDGDDDDDGGS